MRRRAFVLSLACCCLFAGSGLAGPPAAPKVGKSVSHSNLTVFFLHGKSAAPAKTVITLKDAMEKKIVVVHETSNVGLLSVENTSPDVEVFIMAGDVVKGGKQDRAIAFDLILPSKSGVVPMPSFCVERGRWSQRGSEGVAKFECSDSQVCNRALKVAVNETRAQGEVWREVENAQKRLSDNLGKEVNNAASKSSLQLALEDKDLKAKIAEYEKAFEGCCGDAEVVGMAVAINGTIVGADVFASHDLFKQLWPKLLKSAATEAISEWKKDAKFEACAAAKVESFLAEAEAAPVKEVAVQQEGGAQSSRGQSINRAPGRGTAQQSEVVETTVENRSPTRNEPQGKATQATKYRAKIQQRTGAKSLVVESCDKEKPEITWHRSYIAKP
ncbi:MAG: hypothetical protein K1X57_01135 [Gemmataceae bacterium]|nr:hypothetical protein [Gemmataceae bacterium]